MRILLLQENSEMSMRLAFALESTGDAFVEPASSAAEGLKRLASDSPPIDLIIFDLPSASESAFAEFRKATQKYACLRCLSDPDRLGEPPPELHGDGPLKHVDRRNLVEELLKGVAEISQTTGAPAEENPADFCRVNTKLLLDIAPLQGDIYICLSEARGKYVKVFHHGDVFDRADFERFTVRKGRDYLHIRLAQIQEMLSKIKEELLALLASMSPAAEAKPGGTLPASASPPAPSATASSASSAASAGVSAKPAPQKAATPARAANQVERVVDTLQATIEKVGFTKEVQEIAKTTVAVTVKAMGKTPRLAQVLEILKNQGGQYVPAHSNLCAYLSCAIASQMDWGSEGTFSKLTLASLLHDITITNQELARARTPAEAEALAKAGKIQATRAEIEKYKVHPIVASDYVKQMSEIPPDVDTIILQHHENASGTGFPRALAHSHITPLASIFILAHELALQLMSVGGAGESVAVGQTAIAEFAARLRGQALHGHFRRVGQAIEKLSRG